MSVVPGMNASLAQNLLVIAVAVAISCCVTKGAMRLPLTIYY